MQIKLNNNRRRSFLTFTYWIVSRRSTEIMSCNDYAIITEKGHDNLFLSSIYMTNESLTIHSKKKENVIRFIHPFLWSGLVGYFIEYSNNYPCCFCPVFYQSLYREERKTMKAEHTHLLN
jgi:Zn-finger protein